MIEKRVKHIFYSGISWWIFIPIILLFLYFAGLGLTEGKYWAVFMCLLSILFICHLIFLTRYIITIKNELFIQCGFFYFKKIKISEIKLIEPTHNFISAPAASLDRLYLKYSKYGEIIISPKNKQQFIQALTQLNPKIEVKPS